MWSGPRSPSDAEKAERVREKWGLWGNGVRLVVIESPYRTLLEPLLELVKPVLAARRQMACMACSHSRPDNPSLKKSVCPRR